MTAVADDLRDVIKGTIDKAGDERGGDEAVGPAHQEAARPVLPVKGLVHMDVDHGPEAAAAQGLRAEHRPVASLPGLAPDIEPRLLDFGHQLQIGAE